MKEPQGAKTTEDQRHQPKQVRSLETFNSILESAAEMFAEKGYDQTTTHQIAAHASVSVGALYRYFADKEAILKELYRREMTQQRDRIMGEFSVTELIGKDARQLVHKVMEAAFKVFSERTGLRRVLTEQSRKIPELAELRRAQDEEVHQALRQILSQVPGVRLPDLEVGTYLATLFIGSLMEDWLLYRRTEPQFDDARIIDGAVDFILSYIQGRNG